MSASIAATTKTSTAETSAAMPCAGVARHMEHQSQKGAAAAALAQGRLAQPHHRGAAVAAESAAAAGGVTTADRAAAPVNAAARAAAREMATARAVMTAKRHMSGALLLTLLRHVQEFCSEAGFPILQATRTSLQRATACSPWQHGKCRAWAAGCGGRRVCPDGCRFIWPDVCVCGGRGGCARQGGSSWQSAYVRAGGEAGCA